MYKSFENSGCIVSWLDRTLIVGLNFTNVCNYNVLYCLFVAECRIRGVLMFELHAVMAEGARRSSQDNAAVMEALLVRFLVKNSCT